MNTSFTPGPWSIDESKAYNNLVVSSTITGDAICEVLCEPDFDLIGTANARLIAAAPTMFEALVDLLGDKSHLNGVCLHCGRDNTHHENEPCSDDCPGEIARAAINLATGQEP